jgi:hypothetical protein
MTDPVYKKLKKQNGETFAQTLRNYHSGILEIPDIDVVLKYAGRDEEDAKALLPYLMSLMAVNDNVPLKDGPKPEDPFVLLDRAGYNAFHADSLERQNSIRHYFARDELLCTFNDAARYKNFYIVHAIRKDADTLDREEFRGKEARQDDYGTSVISIQMSKKGGFISIKNRYNHSVQYCDNTFMSDPDNIIAGLSDSLKSHFNVDFSAFVNLLPEGRLLVGDQIFKYHSEDATIYRGDHAWATYDKIHEINRGKGDALFDEFYYNHKSRSLKKINPHSFCSFADDFNRFYGGNKKLCVDKAGNLTLDGEILIEAERSRIVSLNLPAFTDMSDFCLHQAKSLISFRADALRTMGYYSMVRVRQLKHFEADALESIGSSSLLETDSLKYFKAKSLKDIGQSCLVNAKALEYFEIGLHEVSSQMDPYLQKLIDFSNSSAPPQI